MKTTNKSTVSYIQHMGNDNTIVDAARVSFDKHHTNYTEEENTKLIKYLAKHGHWSPMAHTSIQLKIDAPIFVARQMVKHQVGGVWNEVSRRYVDDEPVFFAPKWRWAVENKKQGSGDEVDEKTQQEIDTVFWAAVDKCLEAYEFMLAKGISAEQARAVLNLNHMTTWYWTGSLMFFHRVYKQRTGATAQLETQEVAKEIGDICSNLFPTSWRALCQN